MYEQMLKEILIKEDVVNSIKQNYQTLINIIPEIKDMIGFDHKHPHHHLDVWEHTLLALSKSSNDFEIRLALLLHDIGKPHSYQDDGEIKHFKNHGEVSSNIVNKILNRLGFEKDFINEVIFLIKEHDNMLTEKIIESNKNIAIKLFQIQFCDGLAHHPDKLQKRINYLMKINELINEGEEKECYKIKLTNSIR